MAYGGCTQEPVYPEELQPLERTHAEPGEKCKEEGVEERNCYSKPYSPAPRGTQDDGQWVEDSGSKE